MRTILCLLFVLLAANFCALAQFQNFLKARGDKLMDGSEEVRFVSYNIPNLQYIEDNHQFDQVNPWRIADEFEIRDALETIRQTGGNVTRMYVPSVRKAADDSAIVRHVLAPGVFNEEAFRAYDRILQVANQKGVRVIIPLVDNWWWWGGPKEYADFRGKPKEAFWTDSVLIADFKKTVAFLINRVNVYTGVPFKEDRAVFGWETGNELECPYSWTREVAAYIKSLDTNHIVIEGTNSREVRSDALNDPNIDVLTNHFYGPADRAIPDLLAARATTKGRKPYFVGEFGYIPTPGIRRIIDTVVSSGVSGIMIWSLRSHNRDGGFYYHQNAYRWPGFTSGSAWDEQAVTSLIRDKAYQISGKAPAPITPPGAPKLLPITSPYKISWQGSTGASSYLIERTSDDDPLWRTIVAKASDAEIGYRPLYSDTSAEPGKSYTYRITARNEGGYSDFSEPAGPATAAERMLIDELEDSAGWYAASGGIAFLPPRDAARAKEDRSRIGGKTGEYIAYRLPGGFTTITVDVFALKNDADLAMRFLSGTAPDSLSQRSAVRKVFEPFTNAYGAYTCVRYTAAAGAPDERFVKIVLADDCQVGRVEISYGAKK